LGSQIEILPEVGGIQKLILNVAGGVFPSAPVRLASRPLRQESNPWHNNPASLAGFLIR